MSILSSATFIVFQFTIIRNSFFVMHVMNSSFVLKKYDARFIINKPHLFQPSPIHLELT